MPFMELSPKIFDNDDGFARTCPGCRRDLPVTSEFWSIRKATGFRSSYCKKCCSRREVERQQARRRGVPPRRSRCAVCGYLRADVHWIEGYSYCPWCLLVLQESDGRLAGAEGVMRRLMRVRAHNEWETAKNAAWRANKPRRPHRGIKAGEWVPYWNHADCLKLEDALESVAVFLKKEIEEDRAKRASRETVRAAATTPETTT